MERMTKNRITAGFTCAALAAALFAAGCGRVTSPTSSTVSSGAAASGTIGTAAGIAYDAATTMETTDSLALAPHGRSDFFGLPLGIPEGCAYDAGSQSFVCGPDVLRNGLTETHRYQFRDAGDVPQAAYDSVTTASIHFDSHLYGTTTAGPWSTVHDSRALVESGLAGAETSRTWNGTGNAAHRDSVRLRDGSRILVTSATSVVVTNVVVPVPRRPDAWPLSGTIATHLAASGGGQSVDQTATLEFNGTQFAKLTVNGVVCTIDLARPPHGPPGGPCAGPPPPGGSPRDSSGFAGPPPPGGPGGPGGPPGPGGPGGRRR
jgi:hypothetical protein